MTNRPSVPTGSAPAAGKTSAPYEANPENFSTKSSIDVQRVLTWMSGPAEPLDAPGRRCPARGPWVGWAAGAPPSRYRQIAGGAEGQASSERIGGRLALAPGFPP